jgi:tRNA-splicing ligase RtcB (3'-phosphate/5'-hydroxy nucleic acid ligase)
MEYVEAAIGKVPAKLWITSQEFYESDSLVKQTQDIAMLPMAFHHVALMPDAHGGYGMPIGGVLALEGALCPAAVGYDIGCGMIAVRTTLEIDRLRPMRVQVNRAVKDVVPVGPGGERQFTSDYFSVEDFQRRWDWDFSYDAHLIPSKKVDDKLYRQMGTLGGGNHFIEFDYDPNGNVWIVIHSGSRGVGHGIAEHYMKLAEQSNQKWWSPIPKDLASLPISSTQGAQYADALAFALDWARINREVMMTETIDATKNVLGEFSVQETINVHHNDANIENHFGKDVWVHRKGATRAREGERLVIPGNMGQGTAICTGKGNVDSFCSSSHGAGRKLGRNEAKRILDLEACRKNLDDLDVIVSAGRDGALDEMPEAYKDFTEVMKRQSDLVDTDFILTPASVIKG